ncbi:MAG: XrtN system VIT domain-containing protein, partial [Marivirga sp.]|nr:XrtN system VIT domain-containing protein [Marivirga sp.]
MNTNPQLLPSTGKSKNHEKTRWDSIVLIGYATLFASFVAFGVTEYIGPERTDHFSIFVAHYLIALAYVVILIINNAYGIRKCWRKQHINKTIILLNLFLISAYALNRSLPVFEDAAGWLCGYLLITSFNTLSYQYFDQLPLWINRIQHFITGSTFILYLYLALFVSHVYPIGTVGIIFFGIGAHIFVPLTLLAGCIFLVKYYHARGTTGFLISGLLFSILYCASFVKEWSKRVDKINTVANQSVIFHDSGLPLWVTVGQSVPNDWITYRILKSDLVYTTRKDRFVEWEFMPERVSWEESRKHDPLVFISTIFNECSLSADDRVKILQSISDTRHNANERLWSGDHLTTSYVVSDVDIYPDLRLAYTEKYLNVKNNARKSWRGNTEEAIYTFNLPEGAVVTSLSLWINGKEEKGILTSKQKATNAYKTIVGIEQRDPSVVHWQEGNTITVRVFPCTIDEERKFKIGVTSPLVEKGGRLLYRSINFRGPDATDAGETIRVTVIGPFEEIEMGDRFTRDKNGDFVTTGEYEPEFELPMKAVPLRNSTFDYGGFQYSITNYEPEYQSFMPSSIYLDINNTWTYKEIDDFERFANDKHIFIHTDSGFIRLVESNWDLAFDLRERNFSLFPFHLLKDMDHALVVTKGKEFSPHLSDFKDSGFATRAGEYFGSGKKAYVYNLNGKVSTYIKSLKELRAVEFAEGRMDELVSLLNEHTYPKTVETDEQIILGDSKLIISK